MSFDLLTMLLAAVLVPIPQQKPPVRLPEIKVVKIIDARTVYLHADHVLLQRLHGEGLIEDRFFIDGATGKTKLNPNARRPDEMALTVGETCLIGGKSEFQKFRLIEVKAGKAVFQHTGARRNGRGFDVTVTVAPYEDARWWTDPKDRTRETYIEMDLRGRKRLEKHYRAGRLDGLWTQWFANGRKQIEHHFANGRRNGLSTEWFRSGQKRYEGTYWDGRPVGHETWWREDGTVAGMGDHPA